MTLIDDWWSSDDLDPPEPPPEVAPDEVTTDEWWSIDDTVLNTYAFNIATIAGTEQLPPMRGDNVLVGQRPGRRWVPKVPDQRVISLAMWVIGAQKGGQLTQDQRARFRTNWEQLKALFGQPGVQMLARRRYRLLDDDGVQYIHERHALVEIAGTMDLDAQGHTAGAFVVDLLMADPFWYGDTEEVIVDRSSSTVGGFDFDLDFDLVFDVPVLVEYGAVDTMFEYTGVYESLPHIRIDGPVEDPTIWHIQSGARLDLDYDLADGDWLDYDFENRTVTLNDSESVYHLLETGSRWFALERGTNTIRFDATAGAGVMTIRYRPNYW